MDADYALVGGGLQNGLIALALEAVRPAARIVMIERGDAPGGNHTWCFHAGDLASIGSSTAPSAAPSAASSTERANDTALDSIPSWIERLIVARWDSYDVAFPAHARTLASPYACVSSDRFADEVTMSLRRPGCRLLRRATAVEVGAQRVLVRHADNTLEEIHAHVVIDARGPDPRSANDASAASGWQKFLGQELRLDAPHGLARPMLMDATVAQLDAAETGEGFRFLYVLPLSEDRVLVEDTYFCDGTRIDATVLRERIAAYVASRGWRVAEIVREEVGLLPLPLRCAPPSPSAPLVAGYAGGWFHPVTGYSFPIAARLAALVARVPAPSLVGGADLRAMARAQAKQMTFALRLNRMLFGWFPPAQRFRVLERFYRLPEALVRRFYALELTALDKARIFVGRPPRGMSIRAALGVSPIGPHASNQLAQEAP